MKKRPGFSVLFTSILMVLFAVSATWAEDDNSVSLTQDETDGSYYVNMPYVENTEVSSTLTLTADDIASLTNAQTGAVSFKVYDNGGKSENDDGNYTGLYGNYARSTLIINVPENYGLSISGQIYTETNYDFLYIYDGSDNTAGSLAERLASSSWSNVGPFVSTGNAVMLYFESDYSGVYPGLDLTVTLVPVYKITINGLTPNNGELTGSESATNGANVTLTATPSEGYVFVKAAVIDGDGNPVTVSKSGNNITFTMPASNVTVTPYFADPTVLSFDENGCLNNGTYFHLVCESEVCTITQQLVDVPNEDGKDFMCWTEMVQYIEFYQDLQTWTIALGGNLNLGGYDEDAGKCRMAFTPFGSGHAGFNGGGNTIDGFCYIAPVSEDGSSADAGFFGTFSGLSFKKVTFDHAYVKGYRAGVAATTISGSEITEVTIKNATLLGVNLGGLAYSLSNLQGVADVSINTITMNTDATGMPDLTIETTYIGGLAAFASGTLEGAGAVEGLTISNSADIMGARFGGLVGSCAGNNVTKISGAIVTSASIDATGSTSGIAGGIVGESGNEIHVSFSIYEGTLKGGTVGGIIGDAFESENISVGNTYSYGAITSSEHAGYIVGWMSSYKPIDGSDALYNNYHFGEDAVEFGVDGLGYTADSWAAGSSNVYANVRNDNAGSLTASGTLGYHLNEYIDNGSLDGSYMDFFEGAYDDNYYSLVRTANGIATDAEVSSPLLAALMNYNLESTGQNAQWQYADGKVTFGASTEKNHLVVVQAKNLTQMQKDRLGTTPVRYEFRNENEDPTYSGKYTVADGFYGYTDAEGKLDDDFLSNVEGLMSELGTDAMLLNESGEIVSIDLSEKLNSYHILTATAASTYEVVYKYCATTCTDFDAVTTTALAFLTPKVESYVDKENAPLQLVPNVVSFYEEYHSLGSVLKFSVVLQDADGNQLDFIEPQTPDRSEIWSFQDIADKIRAKGISGVAKIVLEYRSLGWPESGTDFPMITVAIEPENWDYEVGIYGYDKNSSMVQVIESSASVGESMTLQYGAGIKANEFGKSRGYNLKDTYSLTYQYTTSVDNGCNKNAGTGKWFGTVADLAETMTECGTAEWTIDNLVVGESGDLVILDSVKMASYMAQKLSGNTATEKLTIVPDYTLVEYNVSFNLNLPTVYDGDNSSVFLGRSWSPSKVMTVEGPNFPKVYSSRCPAPLAEVWSPTANPTEMPEWYFSTEYYVNHVSRNFLNYAAAPAGADSSTIAYVYWNDCSVAQTIPLVYAISVGETQDVSDNPAVTVTLKQTLDATQETPLEISHPMENVNLEQGSDYTHRTMIPVADDTLSFVVNFATKAGYEISGLNFVTTDSASPAVTLQETGETVNLGLVVPTKEHPGDTTLTFNDRIYASMQLNVTLGYVNYEVNFARPVGDNALTDGENPVKVFVPDDMIGETYIGGTWHDSKTYTLDPDSDKEMPKLYAMNGCVAWSYTNPYNASDPVFSEFNEETAESFGSTTDLYPVYMTEADNPSYCTQPTTGYVTVTANVAEATMAHLVAPYVELWQIVGSGATADTIRHTFDQDDVTETLFTLRVPSITRSEAVSESYVPFTFEIHAVTAEGYAAYSESYYTKVVSEDEGNTVETNNYISNITVAGSDVEFYVGALIGGESYTVAFKPENWDRFWTDMGEYNEFKYNIYIADEDRNLPEAYQLGEIAQKLPVLYAATIEQCSSVQNCAGSYVIAGWTIFADSAYCVADRTKSESEDCIKSTSKNLFTTFSGNLIATARAAAAADEITINDDVLYLYPVWRRLDGDSYNTIQVGCPNCADAPMVITLSQTFSVAGQNITLTNSSVDYSHRGYYSSIAFPERWRVPFENFTMDVSFTSNPGYAVESITLDESVSTGIDSRTFEQGQLKASDKYVYAKFIPDEYSFVPYTVTFDIESLEDSIVAFGQSWMNSDGSRSMDVGPNNGFPKMYVLTARDYYGKFNEAFWTKEVKTRDDFEDESGWSDWYWSYVGASMTPLFTSKLVTNVLGENSSETEMTLYPLVVSEFADNNGARNFWRIMLRSDDDTDPNSYHGSVVISQTWNGKTYSQKSDFSNAEVYLHALFVPNADDTLVYDVSLAPDPGYTMSLTSGSFGWTDDDGGSTTVPEDEGWGFNLDDPDAMTLKVQPSKMSRWAADAYVSYTPLHYNVRYSIPEDSPVFVANKLAGGVYSVDWNDTQSDVTVEDLSVPPPVYVAQADGKACRVESWKMSDAEGRTSQGLENEVAYMTSIETDENFVNALIPTLDTVFCDTFHTLWQTLSVEGQGTILLEQVLNVTPENEGDPTEIVVKHSFVEDESGDTVLLTPSIHAYGDGNWSRVGVKLRVVAIPTEGYTFDPKTAIKYERNVDGNHETVVVEDSSFINVMWPLSWKVKFTSLAPIYVTYDLSMESAEDSANTYLPTNAKKSEMLELASNEDVVPFWTPYRTDLCFEGWSTKSMMNRDANDPLYKEFRVDNFADFSTNSDNPTTLYAIWGANCSAEHNWMYVINGNNKTTLTLYQLFGSDTLFHEVSNRYGLSLDGKAFDLYVDPARSTPNEGYHYVEDAAYGLSYTVEESAPVTVAADQETGVWHLSTETIEGEPTYTFDIATEMTDYTLVFDVNADDATVFYGTDWTKEKTLNLASTATEFPVYQRRTDACFDGWAFASHMAAESFRSFGSDFLDAVKSITPTIETVLNDEGEEEDRTVYRLYAQWDESCEPQNYTVSTEIPAAQGSFRIVQVVDGQSTVLTLDGDNSLVVPKDHYVEYDTVLFVPATGYTLAADAEVSIVYSREDENFGVHTFANGSRHNFNDSTGLGLTTATLEVSGLSTDEYILVFNENVGEGEDKPFYGDSWASYLAESFETDDDGNWTVKVAYNATSENKNFPMELYRDGKCLQGYTFDANDDENGVYSDLSEAFLLKLAELGKTNPVTLYPYWNDCETNITVKSNDADRGTLTLTQKFAQGDDAEISRSFVVGASGLRISSTDNDVSVTFAAVDFSLDEGVTDLSLDAERAYAYHTDESAEWVDLTTPFTVTSNVWVKAPIQLNAVFALDANADDVFYAPDFSWNWSTENATYDDRLPENLYRAGYKIAGWVFEDDGNLLVQYNDDLTDAYNAYVAAHEDAPDTLHAVWTASAQIGAYTLQLTQETAELDAGAFSVSQKIGDSTVVLFMDNGVLEIPSVNGLELTVNFDIDYAHTFVGDEPIVLKNSFDAETIASLANGGVITIDNQDFGAPGATILVDVAMTTDAYEFAFDINAGENTVYYGTNWFDSKAYGMAEDESRKFPTSAYQSRNCLAGFSFEPMDPLPAGYTMTMPEVKFYKEIDSDFVTDYKALGTAPTVLYAVWYEPSEKCNQKLVMVATDNAAVEGEFVLTNAGNKYSLPAVEEESALGIPEADDIEFTVSFKATSAYNDYDDGSISISWGDYSRTLANGGTFNFVETVGQEVAGIVKLTASPELKQVEFALDVNAGESSVFFGKDYAKTWSSNDAAFDAELPSGIYRTDAEFVGWAFTALEDNATEGFFTKFDKDFMDAYAAQETVPTTLYAVWKTDVERATYKIASASTDAGDLLVAQFVGEDSLGYAVTAAGLTVPAESDLEFKAYFTVNMEHTLASVSQPLTLMNADEEETPFGTIANGGAFTLQGNTSIVANTSDDAYEFVFDVNAGDATVFYGTNWVENLVVEMTDATASRDFPTSIYRTDKCLQGFSFDSENQETYYEGITEEFVTAFKDGGYSSPKTLYVVWGDCPDDHKNVSVTVANTAAEGWFSLGNYVGDIENEFDLDENHESLLVPVADDLEFTVSFVSGGAYTFNGVINVLDADAEAPTLVKELHSTDTYTFTRNVKLQAVTEFVKVELVFDLNVDDANVFFTSDFDGLTWNVNDYGDEFPSKIVRADKVFAGWGFTRDASEGFTVYDNDFVVACNEFSDSHDLTNVPVTLYALWIDAPEAIETYHVSLQNSYDGKLTLSQSNAGVVTEYEVGTDGIDIPVNANREFRVTFDADYAYSLAVGTPITISEISSMGNVTDETSIANGGVFEFDANSVISVEMGADKYILAFDVNAGDADVFYGTNWFASKTYDMADEDLDAKFPTSVYQNGKCLSGYTFDAAGTGDVFTEINPDFISAYKALEEAPEKLYAVWYTGDCDQASVTVASGNKDHEATFVLTNAGKDYEVSEENPVEVPVASDLEFTVAFTAGSAYSTDDKFSVVMGNSTDAQVSGDTYTFTRNAELLANVNLKFVYVAFNMNAGDANVFYNKNYENVWISEDVEYGTELPKNVYRADADLLGWAFEAIEDDAAEVWFTKFDNDFVEAYAAASAGQGDDPTPLYAVWKTNAERATYTITSTEETLGAGNLVVAQWAFADSVGYAVGADGLKVPAENNLIFRAYFEPLNTHSVVGDLPVALDVDGEVTNVFVGQDFVLAGNTEITVATENDVYVLAFDANADGATLFYGDNWFSGKTYSPADAEEDLNFPTSLYRTDKCLDGFAFNDDESVVYKSISDEFITEFKERELTSPVTLVAVWKNCPETYANYTVAAKDASEGVFTLTNKYGEIANKFEVGSEALVIPAAEDLTFSVTFAENVTVDYENKVRVLAGDETVATVVDGATVSFSQNSELKAVASVFDLTFAFDANKAANDTVFYNSEWSATKSYDLADEEFDYHFPTAYQTSKCLAGFAFSKTATESEAFQEVGTEFIMAYKALEVKPTTLYAVWTTEDCNHGYVVLRSGNTEAEGSFTISDAVNSYELSAGSLMAVPTHVVDFKVTFHEGHAYELENIDLLDDDLNSYSGFANGAEYSFDMNTVLKANVEPKSKGLVFALNADDATVFYGTSYDPKWFENLMNGDFYTDNLPSGIYRNDAVFVGWSFTQMSGVAEGSKFFTKIDDDFYEAFKNHAETRENFDTPDTLYAVWKSAPNREIYTVTVGNKASEGKFRLTNASGGLSNEFLVDATTMLVIPAENDLVFTVSFVSASETAEYEGISVISTTGTQIAVIEMGDEYTFRKDVMLRAISYMPTMEFALDVNAGDADVFYESDFGFKWWASSYGQYLPTGIYRTDAKLVGWSLDKNATPDKAFKEIDDAFNEAVESYMEHYGEDLIGDISEGDFDLSKIQEMYGMDFAQMSRGPVLYAVWEKANVKTVSVKSNSLRQGSLTLQQLVDDSTFTFVVGENGFKVPYVEGGLEFRAHFEANESHLLNSGKSLVWNAAAADTTKNDEFVLVSEATSFDALVKVVGFNLAFNAESKETLFYGDDWTSGKKVIAKGTSASQFPTMVYSASRCLVGWTLKNDAVAYTEMQDELANKLYEKYPKLTDTTKINMYALWSDSPDQCSALMTRVSVEQDKGEVMLVEKTGEFTEVVHKFNEKGSMMLPSDIVSAEWTLRSAPDSSYALDSLTIVRNDKLLAVLREGGNLPGNMDNAVFKAHFSKANKTPVEIVERHFAQSGNAVQLNIKASEFEVTRGVEARVRVFDVKDDSVVLDSLLGDSVAMGFESEVVLRMKRTGDYKVVLTLEDEKESDAFKQEFGVKSSIASVGKDGWQMVSLAAVDTSAINWTSDDQVFYWWDEFGNGGDYWQYKRYNRGDSVVATRGAWYSSLDSLPLVLKRDIEDDGEDAVWKLDSIHSGWNLVANTHGWEVSLFAGHADEEKDVDEESEISFYRYNSETADYEETKYLKPYEAVWAKVGKKKNWKVSAAPVFAKATEREPQPEKPEGGRMLPKRVLAKASTKDRWVLQAVLSDKNGKQDAWNILGAGNNPFSAEEPPESMGDHVNLSIVEGKRALAKSIKSASDEMEWTVALSASNDRVGYLTLVGIDDVNAFGYRVFVTVDGNTTEMKDGVPLQVLLKSNAKTATVRVAPAAKVVAQNSLKGLRSARLGGKLKVSFEATGLAGTNARVDLLDMKGHVMSTVNAKTLEGTNALVLDAPKSGLYMLRVRAGSQQQAAKVMVK